MGSDSFIDIATSIKWYCFVIIGSIIILVYNICSFFNLKTNVNISYLYYIISILCLCEAIHDILQYVNQSSSFNSRYIVGSFDNPTGFAASLCSGLISIYVLWKMYIFSKNNIYVQIAGYSLLGIMIFSMFSYPLEYPFVWIMIILSIIVIVYYYYNNLFSIFTNRVSKLVIIPLLLLFIFHNFSKIKADIQWNQKKKFTKLIISYTLS